MRFRTDLQRLPRGSNEIAKNRNIRAVSTDASGVPRQAKPLGKVKIHARVVQLRQTKTLRGQHAIQARRVNRTWRTVTPPGAPRQLVKLLPIAFVPSRH